MVINHYRRDVYFYIMEFKHIVFDLDGTLIDTHDAIISSLRTALSETTDRHFSDKELSCVIGVTGEDGLSMLGVNDVKSLGQKWNYYMKKYHDSIRLFDGIKELIAALKKRHIHLGIVTSELKHEYEADFLHFGIEQYFDTVILADATQKHKPFPDPLLKYIDTAHAEKQDVLYIGDTLYDVQCASSAEVASGLALWGCKSIAHIRADYYFKTPLDVLSYLDKKADPLLEKPWLKWAMELQAIAQAGLYYSENKFDIERFERISSIAAEMLNLKTGIPIDKVKNIFCSEKGYQTPKIDTRAVIFNEENEILLVQESDKNWSLPGGWADINESIADNTAKEAFEESGLHVVPCRIIAVHDRNRHNWPIYAYSICKFFIECSIVDGHFQENTETLCSEYFSLDNLPPLSNNKNTLEQIKLCFTAHENKNWLPVFD